MVKDILSPILMMTSFTAGLATASDDNLVFIIFAMISVGLLASIIIED